METINPYQPPQGDGLAEVASKEKVKQPVYDTRWQATRAGMWRGAVLGMKVGVPVSAILLASSLLIFIAGTIKQAEHVFFTCEFFLSYAVLVAKLFSVIVGVGIFIVLVCVIPGGLFMGLINLLCYRAPE